MSEIKVEIISPRKKWLDFRLKEVLSYKDLIFLFVHRDFVAEYKQTILGPIWFLLKPLLYTLVFTVVFGKIGQFSTTGIPPFLFYLSGIVTWKYFEECVRKTSSTFIDNSNIFGKVYFPRLVVPISIVISSCITFAVQFLLFLCFYIFMYFDTISLDLFSFDKLILFPFVILIMAMLGLGMGIIISSLTTKYRDLRYLVDFGVQLMMYASPVLITLDKAKETADWLKYIVYANPMTGVINAFRYIFFDGLTYSIWNLAYSLTFTLIVLFIGIVIFNRVEKTFMDTV